MRFSSKLYYALFSILMVSCFLKLCFIAVGSKNFRFNECITKIKAFETKMQCSHSHRIGLNIFIHINENKHVNKQYITMVYDGIQKEAIRLIRICFPCHIELCVNHAEIILITHKFWGNNMHSRTYFPLRNVKHHHFSSFNCKSARPDDFCSREALRKHPHMFYTPSFTFFYTRKGEIRGTQNEDLFYGLD